MVKENKKKRSILSMFLSYYKKEILVTMLEVICVTAVIVAIVYGVLDVTGVALLSTVVVIALIFISEIVIPFIKFFKVWYKQMKLASSLGSKYSGSVDNWWIYVLFDVFEGAKIYNLPKYCIGEVFKEVFPDIKIASLKDIFEVYESSSKDTLKERKDKIRICIVCECSYKFRN